jgi:solute carrier family 10 (sodium/bile acid cotransporter), member 7
MQRLARFIPDRFTILLIVTVLIASLLPAHGQGVAVFSWITNFGRRAIIFSARRTLVA